MKRKNPTIDADLALNNLSNHAIIPYAMVAFLPESEERWKDLVSRVIVSDHR